ncbi:MAG TPA: DUF2510 domain-containing protein [Acidimicrobiales bacterium]
MEEQDRSSARRWRPAARRGRVASAMGAGLIAVLVPIGWAMPAGAAGSPALDQKILPSPISGWPTMAPSYLDNYVTYINALEQAAVGPGGGTAVTAAEGWRSPASAQNFVLITLVRITDASLTTIQSDQQLQQAARAAAASFCTGATGSAAKSVVSLVGIPHSYMVTCRSEADGRVPSAITWSTSNVLAIVASAQGAVGGPQLDQIAVRQYGAMSPAPSGGGSSAGLDVGLGVGALIIALSVVAAVRRARRHSAVAAALLAANEEGLVPVTPAVNPAAAGLLQEISATPQAGWYADPLDSSKRRYWTGTEWRSEAAEAPSGSEAADGEDSRPEAERSEG